MPSFDFFSRRLMKRLNGEPEDEKKIDVDYKTNTLDMSKLAQENADQKLKGIGPTSTAKTATKGESDKFIEAMRKKRRPGVYAPGN